MDYKKLKSEYRKLKYVMSKDSVSSIVKLLDEFKYLLRIDPLRREDKDWERIIELFDYNLQTPEMKGQVGSHPAYQAIFREKYQSLNKVELKEKYKEYFDLDQESPHMLIATQVNKKKHHLIPAVVHVDGSCRVQTVSKETNLKFYNLIKEFYNITSIPVLLNTSFNVKGQPMVNNPAQAIDTFKGTKIDVLVIGDFIVRK